MMSLNHVNETERRYRKWIKRSKDVVGPGLYLYYIYIVIYWPLQQVQIHSPETEKNYTIIHHTWKNVQYIQQISLLF
jgi:hypothetical protein